MQPRQPIGCKRCPNIHGMSGQASIGTPLLRLNEAVTGSPTRSGYAPDFELFPSAIECCLFLTVKDNHQKARSRPLPATAVARRVGALRVLKDTTTYYLATRDTSLSGDDFLRTTSALPKTTNTGSQPRQKAPARPRPNQAGLLQNLGRPKF